MKDPIILKIDGDPVPWAAARITRKGHYDIRAQAKHGIIWQLKSKYHGEQLEGALRVDLFFAMPIPASTSKKRRELMISGKIPHTSKPDRTNCCKLYEDCLERAKIIKNDSQIVAGEPRKFYHDKPHTLIVIQRLEYAD